MPSWRLKMRAFTSRGMAASWLSDDHRGQTGSCHALRFHDGAAWEFGDLRNYGVAEGVLCPSSRADNPCVPRARVVTGRSSLRRAASA